MTHQKFLFLTENLYISAWFAQCYCRISEKCIQSTFCLIGLVKGLNTAPETPYRNTPYIFISNDGSDGIDLVDAFSQN